MDSRTLHEHIERMRAGDPPIPLLEGQGRSQALRLRERGLPYSQIAIVMETYHGVARSGDAWRHLLRGAGAAPKHYNVRPRRIVRRVAA